VPRVDPYAVPFEFDRSTPPHYRLVNVGGERLAGVSALLGGRGVMPALPPTSLGPRESVELVIRGDELALDATLVVRWLRPSGEEYLWRVAF
jgi:hypothetical protein